MHISSMVDYSSASDFHSSLLASQSFTVIVILVPRFYLRKWVSCFAHAIGPSKQTMTYYISLILT